MERILFVGETAGRARDIQVPGMDRYEILEERDEKSALNLLRNDRFAAVVVRGTTGNDPPLELIAAIRHCSDPDLPIIVISPRSEGESVVSALRRGACDYIHSSEAPEILTDRIRHALRHSARTRRRRHIRNYDTLEPQPFIVASSAMREVDSEITRLASLDYDVLLLGETGVGKDRIAAELHRRSPRSEQPFMPIPLRSLNESLIESELFGYERGAFTSADHLKIGRFEAADEGTVYIPEISCLNESVQLKLLYFMQYRRTSRVGQDPRKPETQLNVRMIMASNDDLEELVGSGQMREDFYHRIAGVQLYIPPLRERKEDIVPLASAYLEEFSGAPRGARFDFSPGALELLQEYHWPGNVRQLENAVKAAIAYAQSSVLGVQDVDHVLHIAHLHSSLTGSHTRSQSPPQPYACAIRDFQKTYFEELMRHAGGKVSNAARICGLTPQWIRRILKSLSLR
jgi:DNA-binding NtrC family response regulator